MDLRSARASRTFFHDFAELEIRQQCVCVPVVRVRTRVGYDVFFVFAFAAERAKVFFLASPQNGTLQTR
jgi:histidinol-phosphate/aromatic aminotransferase/cobyric acid decarboxylase-like protein